MLLIWGASLAAFNMWKSPRKTVNEISPAQFPKQSSAVGFASPRKEDLIKGASRVPKRQERGVGKLKECLTTRSVSQANEEAPALMKDKTWQAMT